MLSHDTRGKIKNITAGNVIEESTDTCTKIRNYLCSGFPTSTTVKRDFESKLLIKEEQAKRLIAYSKRHDLWLSSLPVKGEYFTCGGEALVFFSVGFT